MSQTTPEPPTPVTFDDVRHAAERICAHAHRTPVMTSRTVDEQLGGHALFKCECFQRIGAFKFRGACNAVAQLDRVRSPGIITWSSGNHAQAIALAAALHDVPATIVMPANAPAVKLAATRGYLAGAPAGSEIVIYDPATQVREEVGHQIAEERGLTIIPPYDHPHVIAGQGTAALELIEDHGPLDLLFVCVGGGGLLSGSAIATKALLPDCAVIGVEPELADDATRSFRTGTLQSVHNPPTIADGARTPSLGHYTFPLVLRHVDDMMTVSDEELLAAMRLVWERMKVLIEPTGALALAGALRVAREAPDRLRDRRIGVIFSGGNADFAAILPLLGS